MAKPPVLKPHEVIALLASAKRGHSDRSKLLLETRGFSRD